MIFVNLIFLGIVIAAVVLRRAGVGMGASDSQIDSVYELLEDEAKPATACAPPVTSSPRTTSWWWPARPA